MGWVNSNKNKILSLDKDFILSAEESIKFTSFCLTVIELEKDPDFKVKTPVFFDATCSGLQHLASVMRDDILAPNVNLDEQTYKDVVSDVYSILSKPINEEIRRVGRDNPIYENLSEVNLPRKILKRSVMTTAYNVSIFGIKEQIASFFKSKKVKLSTGPGEEKTVVQYLKI